MVVTPVLALNSIKRDGIGRVANNPVQFWIFRNGRVDSIFGKRGTSLEEESSQTVLQGTLHHCLLPDRPVQSKLYRR